MAPMQESTAVIQEIEAHAFSDVRREVGGILIGTFGEDTARVSAALPALKAVGSQTNVTFTHEVWDEVLAVIERDHPGERIVGWYHTHPGFGLFLSEYDMFIHKNFFSDPRMLALVVDPLAGDLGWFIWRDNEVVLDATAPTTTPALGPLGESKEGAPHNSAAGLRRYAMVTSVLILGAGIGGYLLGQQPTENVHVTSMSQQLDQAQSDAGVARARAAAANHDSSQLRSRLRQARLHGPGHDEASTGTTAIVYRVGAGDTLWSIAESLYGDGTMYRHILRADAALTADRLQVGQVIRVPDVESFSLSR
jgi:nucleoid-associated protein YgaU